MNTKRDTVEVVFLIHKTAIYLSLTYLPQFKQKRRGGSGDRKDSSFVNYILIISKTINQLYIRQELLKFKAFPDNKLTVNKKVMLFFQRVLNEGEKKSKI